MDRQSVNSGKNPRKGEQCTLDGERRATRMDAGGRYAKRASWKKVHLGEHSGTNKG